MVIVPVVKGLNIINLYAIYDPVTRPEQPICVALCVLNIFQNAMPSDFELLRIKKIIFCILSKPTKVSIYSRT